MGGKSAIVMGGADRGDGEASLSSKPLLPRKLLSTVNFSATPSPKKPTPSICADRDGRIYLGVKGDSDRR